ncbi:hypothetical protein BACINT_02019 [Bacteroides intestinalis DSM 17393]|uniref:Uncharacterized protein n=3 Tax=Bacteroides TaxID=816 RepID=B3CBY4_9BACE|nr:hypothetical protein BACINT_02019 [Bacteroides intestinalis DSM 17393]EEF87540.1 hypothetical protein BACCELL_04869 [Bacteroides cellulosilyticus DSM 14838]KXT41693.1 hypothetical protein HMPREF2531_04887 [Bacteroides intestinalis]
MAKVIQILEFLTIEWALIHGQIYFLVKKEQISTYFAIFAPCFQKACN